MNDYETYTEITEPKNIQIECGDITISNRTGSGYLTEFYIDGVLQEQVYELTLKINGQSISVADCSILIHLAKGEK